MVAKFWGMGRVSQSELETADNPTESFHASRHIYEFRVVKSCLQADDIIAFNDHIHESDVGRENMSDLDSIQALICVGGKRVASHLGHNIR